MKKPYCFLPIGGKLLLFNTEKMAEGGGEEIEMGKIDKGGWDSPAERKLIESIPDVPVGEVGGPSPGFNERQRQLIEEGRAEQAKKELINEYMDFIAIVANSNPGELRFNPSAVDYGLFERGEDGKLFIKKGDKLISLSGMKGGTGWRSLKAVFKNIGVKGFESLGLEFVEKNEYQKKLPGQDEIKSLKKAGKSSKELIIRGVDSVTPEKLDEISKVIEKLPKDSELKAEDLIAYHVTLDTISEQIRVQAGKQIKYNNNIKELEDQLEDLAKRKARGEEDLEPEIDRIGKKLEEAVAESAANKEHINDLKGRAVSQVKAIKNLIVRLLDRNTSLGEKLRAIFREQGITVAAIITALGAIIAALVEGLTGGSSGAAVTSGGSGDGGKNTPRSAAKRAFDAMASGLKWLASKAAAALPGIIGAIVSFLLKGAAAVASWLGANLWAVLVVVGGVGYGVVRRALRDKRGGTLRKKNR